MPNQAITQAEELAVVNTIREWLVSTDHPVSQWERDFADAVSACIRSGPPYASDNWDIQGYKSPAEEIDDMANVGRSLMDRIASVICEGGEMAGWSPMDDPAEIVTDMANMIHESRTASTAGLVEWQPIETAPKDGRDVVAWGYLHDDGGPYSPDGRSIMGEKPHLVLVRWEDGTGWVSRMYGSFDGATHWMPLPAPPATLQEPTK